ncbi:HEPN domain-containing protein [uncultured Methanobrevibacter sp.]|uniref:HEPN domain-containing protein n=1 Tax=uncultured Methanobrevibacter sp. TaxID=253161 RepID=UPI002620F6CE
MDKVEEALNVGKSQLISSRLLFENGQYRDSITLSYYAMYSSALALLLKKDISPKTHDGTLRQLGKEYVKEGLLSRESYRYIYDARSMRNKSSYDYSMTFTEELAEELILNAEKFISETESIL